MAGVRQRNGRQVPATPVQLSFSTLCSFLEISPDALLLVDQAGMIKLFNEQTESLFGYTREELLSQPLERLLPERFRESHVAHRERYFSLPRTRPLGVGLPLFGRRKDSTEFPVDISLRPLLLDGDVHVLGAIRDVTQQRAAELERAHTQRLEDANRTYRALLDSTQAAILYIAPDGCVRDVNLRFTEMFGISAGRAIGRPLRDFLGNWQHAFQNPEGFAATIEETFAQRELSFSIEVAQRTPEHRDFLLYSTPVRGARGDYLGRFYSLRDITHEKIVDRMKSELVALASHELRTPLTSIKGYVDYLLRDPGRFSPRQLESLEIVQRNARRLVDLVNDLLDLSRLEAGKVELRCSVFDLTDLVQELVQSLQPQVRAKEQILSTSAPAAPAPLFVNADRQRIAQVLTNLLSNASKFTPIGGRITLSLQPQEGQVCICVSDTGIGMTPEEQSKLFTKFFRSNNAAVQEAGGTGLGLVITQALVQVHGGELEVSSSPGQGSAFSFMLPLVEEGSG